MTSPPVRLMRPQPLHLLQQTILSRKPHQPLSRPSRIPRHPIAYLRVSAGPRTGAVNPVTLLGGIVGPRIVVDTELIGRASLRRQGDSRGCRALHLGFRADGHGAVRRRDETKLVGEAQGSSETAQKSWLRLWVSWLEIKALRGMSSSVGRRRAGSRPNCRDGSAALGGRSWCLTYGVARPGLEGRGATGKDQGTGRNWDSITRTQKKHR
jgi:hypothetical protein